MPEYVFAYYGGSKMSQQSQEAGEEGRKEFGAWIGEMGSALVNPGTPLGPTTFVGDDEGEACSHCGESKETTSQSHCRLTGFSIVKADSLEAAVAMAKNCPFTKMGTIGVSEAMQM